MRLGVRCHDVIHSDLDELGGIIHEKDFKSVHLALKKVKTGFKLTKGSITPGMARYVRDIFSKHDINISILGCYINLANPDDEELKCLLDTFKEHIRFARDFGCSIVGTETGALNKEYVYTPENNTEEAFQRTLSSIKILVEEAEKFGVIVGIEGVSKHDINISILGCYINLANPDDEELKCLLDTFKEHIRFARDFGCSIVGTETGALNKEYVYTPENNTEEAFQRTLNSIKILVAEAEKFGVMVGIEGVAKHVINTPERMKRVLDNVDSNNLQVIFDPVNLINENNYDKQDDLIRKSFELFGDKIVAIHAKDFEYTDGKIKLAAIGQGQFNYPLLLSLIKEKKPYIDVLLESTTPEDIDEAIIYITKIYNDL